MQNQDDDHSNLQIISKKILSKLHKGDEGISPEFSPEEFLNVNLSDDSEGNNLKLKKTKIASEF